MRLSFANFELDTERFELLEGGRPCAVEPRVFDLIRHFAEHPGQVFSHEDLIEQVWKGRYVSDSTVSTAVKNARKVLGDSGSAQQLIRTVRGRGFVFDASVSESGADAGALPAPPPRQAASFIPALLIWPLRRLSDDSESAQISAALAGDLGSILTRIPLLRVSVQTGRSDTDDIGRTARSLYETMGVDFVFDGTLQRIGPDFRINAQLVDARTGFQLWSELFTIKGPIEDALTNAPIAVVARLEPRLHRAMYENVRSADYAEPNARQLFVRASSVMALKGWHFNAFSEAAGLLRESCDREPGFALAHSFRSLVMGFGDRIGLMTDREKAKTEALEAAERSLELDSQDSTVLGYSGCALADIGYLERAEPILKNAIDLNATNAQAWAALGTVHLQQGRLDDGIQELEHGISISPMDGRLSVWGSMLTMGLLLAKRLDEAREQGELACQRDDRCYLPRLAMAAVHLASDDRQTALQLMNDAYRIKPDLTPLQIATVVGRDFGESLRQLHQASQS